MMCFARFLSMLLPFLLFTGTVLAGGTPSSNPGLLLRRIIPENSLSAGEIGQVSFELANNGEKSAEYTLIEEIPSDLSVLETGSGSYSRTAGLIAFRGTLGGGKRQTLSYTFQMQEGPASSVPLYGYLSTTDGFTVDSAETLTRVELALQLTLEATLVPRGEATVLRLSIRNPFARPLPVNLDVAKAEKMNMSPPMPASLHLGPGELWEHESDVRGAEAGSHWLSVRPTINGLDAGKTRQVTLRVHDGERPRQSTEDAAATPHPRITALTRRTHSIRLAKRLLAAGERLLVTVPIPAGASYVPASALMDGEHPVEAVVRQNHLLFFLPFAEQMELSYVLQYSDRELIGAAATSDSDAGVGLLALGVIPRLLRGEEELLMLLQGEMQVESRPRHGVVILAPHAGQVFAERGQVDIDIDAPRGTGINLIVNDQEIPKSRVGSLEVDEALDRQTVKYIAVPLRAGPNSLLARAITPDGEPLTDTIVIYRSGPPATLTIDPVTELRTGGVRPLMVQIAAADTAGLPPPDGTVVTVRLEGGKILSEDAHADWLGHQLLLYGGRGLLQIESPPEAVTMTVRAQIGEIASEKHLMVRNEADSWLVIGNGQVRAEASLNSSQPVSVSSEVRLFARGPLGHNTVFTSVLDSTGLGTKAVTSELWTGDTSSAGAFGSGSGKLSARLERGASYLQYGSGLVEFEGKLSKYSREHDGFQLVVDEGSGLRAEAFYARESLNTIEEAFDGDGTGYYRVNGRFLEPRSEELAIVARAARFPHEVVCISRLELSGYYIDYRTGQIVLAEPLGSADAEGNRLSLRVRYRLAGSQVERDLGGLQGTVKAGPVQLQATMLQNAEAFGPGLQLISLGAKAELKGITVDLEAGRSHSKGSKADGYALSVKYPDLWGWALALAHRDVGGGFVSTEANVQDGILTSFSGQRSFHHGLHLTTSASVARKNRRAPWSGESTLGIGWLWGLARPKLMLKANGGEAASFDMELDIGVTLDFASGALSYNRQQPIVGSEPIRDLIKASHNLTGSQAVQFAVEEETDATGVSKKRVSWGLTQKLEGSMGNAVVTGGYEFAESSGVPEGAMVVGANSRWAVNERNSVELSLDHRRPLLAAAPLGFGGALGWTYHHPEGESEFRFDRRTGEGGLKQSFQWRGYHSLEEDLAYRGDALWTVDNLSQLRHRLSLGTAYRTRSAVIFADVTSDHVEESGSREWSIEWRVKSASMLTPNLRLHVGYANRKTLVPTTTDKATLGVRYSLSPQTEVLIDSTLLRQWDTQTQRSGTMAGLSRQVYEDLWLTLGWKSAGFTGFETTGAEFAQQRSSLFMQVDLAFDEWSLKRWLSPRRGD